MNHYESRAVGGKDDRALARIEAIDPEGLFATVLAGDPSRCAGSSRPPRCSSPRATAGATAARVVARRDSGDETGDAQLVVGYAGVILAPHGPRDLHCHRPGRTS